MRSIVIYQFSLIVDKFIIGKSYGYYTKPVTILLLIYPGGNAVAVQPRPEKKQPSHPPTCH
jgi:hypothetical protein